MLLVKFEMAVKSFQFSFDKGFSKQALQKVSNHAVRAVFSGLFSRESGVT